MLSAHLLKPVLVPAAVLAFDITVPFDIYLEELRRGLIKSVIAIAVCEPLDGDRRRHGGGSEMPPIVFILRMSLTAP